MAGTFSIPVPRNGADVPWISTGITLEKGDEAQILVEGQLKLGLTAAFKSKVCTQEGWLPYQCGHYQRIGYALIGPRGGVPGGSGAHDDMLRVIPGLNRDGVRTAFGGGDGSPDGRIVGSAKGPGTIEVMRFGIPPSSALHHGIQIYDLTGTQTVTVFVNRARKRKLVLECNDARGSVSVERGSTIDCTAKVEPEGTPPQVTKWTFEGEGSTVQGPAGSTSWGGPMVVGGSITVEATVDGKSQEESVSVTVKPREWNDELPQLQDVRCPSDERADCPLNSPLRYERDMGQTILYPEPISATVAPISGGPNNGWWFINNAGPPVRFREWVMYLNIELYNQRSDFYRRHRGCDPSAMQEWIVTHENVHVSVTRSAIAANRLNPTLERTVAYGAEAFNQKYRDALGDVISRLRNLGDPSHRRSYPSPPCDLRLRPNPR